jgi:hypothetical protein
MSRIHPQHQPIGACRGLAILALAVLAAGGLLTWPAGARATPARSTALHKARPLKTLPMLKAGATPASTSGVSPTVSPYARAAAQRNESGRLPPGHAYVLPRTTPNMAGQPAP